MDHRTCGLPAALIEQYDTDQALAARVTAVHRGLFEVACRYGLLQASLKAGEYYGGQEPHPTVGDYVLLTYVQNGDSLITKTLPRSSRFSRSDTGGRAAEHSAGVREQLVAANFDVVFLLSSLNRDFNLRRIDRYLALAWNSGALPVVLLTKQDLAEDAADKLAAAREAAPGVQVLAVSARTGMGLDAVKAHLSPGSTAVFLGSSGVGKSSLVNALAGKELMEVSDIREQDSKGRHTTTHRQMFLLPSGGLVIDTPGMREIGLWEAEQGVSGLFSDIEQLFTGCRFRDCTHTVEPDCAVLRAIEEGRLSPERWDSYNTLKREARYTEDKAAFLAEREQWGKQISKFLRKNPKNRW